MEVLWHLERGILPRSDLLLKVAADGVYVLPNEKLVWQRGIVWCFGEFKLTFLGWLALGALVFRYLFLAPIQSRQWLEFLNLLAAKWIVGPAIGLVLANVTLWYLIVWSRGTLILTNLALYYMGWFINKHIPLAGIYEFRFGTGSLSVLAVLIPPDRMLKFAVGRPYGQWLLRAMENLTNIQLTGACISRGTD